jgi:NAD(P)-dependent dehydrogenase (short-subunit alcohol dehydrogenase family)
MELDGRRAVVTGGTRGGIGAAVTARLTDAGARVLTTARSAPDDLADRELFVAADVGTAEGVARVAAAALHRLGGVDIVVHVVGGSRQEPGGVLALTDDDWQHAFAVNLFASVRLDRALLPSMIDQGRGAIVHVTSIQRRAPLPTTVPYAAAKAALTSYSKNLASQVAPAGVRVNTVAPGFVETAGARGMVSALAAAGRRGRGHLAAADHGLDRRDPARPPGPAGRGGRADRLPRVRSGVGDHGRGARHRRRKPADDLRPVSPPGRGAAR